MRFQHCLSILVLALTLAGPAKSCGETPATLRLRAGIAKADISSPAAKTPGDPLYARALVVTDGTQTAVIIAVDAVAISGIGSIRQDYLAGVRDQLQHELGIPPRNVLISATHCHGAVGDDIEQKTVKAVKQAWQTRVEVLAGTGQGFENRIMENRRLRLKKGGETDVRHAYSLPPGGEIAGLGPVDPEIGILRLDRLDGSTLAVVYNFACHPIQGIPGGGNTADISGFASKVIEENQPGGCLALFLQGCAGDINPVLYKEVNLPRNAETLGNLLGLSVLKAARTIPTKAGAGLQLLNETVALPRADHRPRIAALQREQTRLLQSLAGASLNLETFIPLYLKYRLAGDFPSGYAHEYLRDQQAGRQDWIQLDTQNRQNLEQYIHNIHIMEELTRLQANLALLQMHQARNVAAGQKTVEAEIMGLRIGSFVLVTFPGELTVQIGLNLKKRSSHPATFVAGYANGYLFYAPTIEQALNPGYAQEDCDCLLAPEWQPLFENKAAELVQRLAPKPLD